MSAKVQVGQAPTPQGISALLRKAGFHRSETFATGARRGEVSARGYHVTGASHQGAVTVRWRVAALQPVTSNAALDAMFAERDEMLAAYAKAIEAAGWAVQPARNWLIVTGRPVPGDNSSKEG